MSAFLPPKPLHPVASSVLSVSCSREVVVLVQAICRASAQKAPWSNVVLLNLWCISAWWSSELQAVARQTQTLPRSHWEHMNVVSSSSASQKPCHTPKNHGIEFFKRTVSRKVLPLPFGISYLRTQENGKHPFFIFIIMTCTHLTQCPTSGSQASTKHGAISCGNCQHRVECTFTEPRAGGHKWPPFFAGQQPAYWWVPFPSSRVSAESQSKHQPRATGKGERASATSTARALKRGQHISLTAWRVQGSYTHTIQRNCFSLFSLVRFVPEYFNSHSGKLEGWMVFIYRNL